MIYPVRPYMCRGFLSEINCAVSGYAQIPPYILTLNTVVQQIIEHISNGAAWGLLTEVMLEKSGHDRSTFMPACQKIPGFIIPAEEKFLIHNQLIMIKDILASYHNKLPQTLEISSVLEECLRSL